MEPQYPNKNITKKLNEIIRREFSGKEILIRCISSKSHKQINTKKLIEIIKKTGTDRYNSDKKVIFHDFYSKYNPDIFASPFKVTKKHPDMGNFFMNFILKQKVIEKGALRLI